MARLGLESDILDPTIRTRAVNHLANAGVLLPTLAELADPSTIDPAITKALDAIDPDSRDPLNLFRVHWYNGAARPRRETPAYIELPPELTGVQAPIIVALGQHFPMIHAHKVLAAYGCLVPRIVTGQFDPTQHRAIWPSTGNYCRGGIAISRILGCRGVAVLPEGMSRERFDWLDRWIETPDDIVRTPGSESNVKEIYDCCAELDKQPDNVIFNQFCEYGNHLIHWRCTGPALGSIFEHVQASKPELQLRAYVSATGSGGTLAAGDYLKDKFGSATVAAEALECPTLLANGYGEHNIQGIGDKHIPLIHNVMQTDFVVAVSERTSDGLGVLFNHPAGREYLETRHQLPKKLLEQLPALGLSSLANVAAAIKLARYLDLGPDQAIVTVATDNATM
ncbi:MAG: pyridoxal-phosphate dependent enzyme, partial [Nannocystaceae bacterium]